MEEARGEARHVRELWYQTCVDIQNECQKKLEEKDKEHSRQIREKDETIKKLQAELQRERELLPCC